jgi:diguanylate cyclase (GGDEF)-like protein
LADLTRLDDEALFAALDELRAREVLVLSEGKAHFATGGLEDAVYAAIGEPRQLALHAEMAARLEQPPLDRPSLDVARATSLARHMLRGREVEKALQAAFKAAELNMAIYAVEAARSLLRDGLALSADAPARFTAWRRDYLLRLATVERWRGDFAALGACLDEALPIAEQLEESGPLAQLLLLQGVAQTMKMTPVGLEAAVAYLLRATELAGNDAAFAGRCQFSLGQAFYYMGRRAEALASFEAAAGLSETAGQPFWRAKSLAFMGYLEATGEKALRGDGFCRLNDAAAIQARLGDRYGQGFTAALQGDALLQAWRLPEAETAFHGQSLLNEALGVGEDLVVSLANLAAVYALQGRYREAITAAQRAVPMATQYRQPVGLLATAVLGFANVGTGDLGGAITALRAAEQGAQGSGGYMFLHAAPYLLEAWLKLGRADEARRLGEVTLALLPVHPSDALDAQIKALLAEAHLRLNDDKAATQMAQAAFQKADVGEHPFARFLATRVQARLALRLGRTGEARELAEQARAIAVAGGAAGFAAEAAGLAGAAALAAGRPDSLDRFRAMQAFADRAGVPFVRAIALAGQAAAEPSTERSDAMAGEARQIIRSLTSGLTTQDAKSFEALEECARITEDRPGSAGGLSIESGPLVFDRIKSVSEDLMGFATQYGALFGQWITSKRQLEMLNALARRVNESLDLDDVLTQVVTLTLELTQAERAFAMLASDDGTCKLVCRAQAGRQQSDQRQDRVPMAVCEAVLESGQPMTVLDAVHAGDGAESPANDASDLRALMCVPLAAHGKSLGVLYVDSHAAMVTFTRKDLELLTAIAAHASQAIGNATLYAASQRHAAELESALEKYRLAERKANTDALTGLANRRSFEELASREMDAMARYNRSETVILMDVDHFKHVNDTYGHATGDEVLKALAEVLRACCRVCDMPARLGGEEFVVLCQQTTPAEATVLAERIRQATMAVHQQEGLGVSLPPITVSLGIAPILNSDASVAEALDRADQALYACKRGGRNQVRLWEPAVPEEASEAPLQEPLQ